MHNRAAWVETSLWSKTLSNKRRLVKPQSLVMYQDLSLLWAMLWPQVRVYFLHIPGTEVPWQSRYLTALRSLRLTALQKSNYQKPRWLHAGVISVNARKQTVMLPDR